MKLLSALRRLWHPAPRPGTPELATRSDRAELLLRVKFPCC